jgi:hypothetical protein
MPYIPCPGGLSSKWKTKSEALKWLNKVYKWPCGPVSNCQGGIGCERTGLFGKTKLRDGSMVCSVVVNCTCLPPGIPTGQDTVTTWVPVSSPAKARTKAKSSK